MAGDIYFFRRFQIPMPRCGVPMKGLGSGFITSPDGIILTNAHVVTGADRITVKLTDRRKFKAKLVGIDKPSDIAVQRIDAKNLPTMKIGDSALMRVGEWLLAICPPFGFENSAIAGIVFAKSRSLPDEGYVALNSKPVRSVDQLRSLVTKAGKHVALLVQRDESKIFVPIDLGRGERLAAGKGQTNGGHPEPDFSNERRPK